MSHFGVEIAKCLIKVLACKYQILTVSTLVLNIIIYSHNRVELELSWKGQKRIEMLIKMWLMLYLSHVVQKKKKNDDVTQLIILSANKFYCFIELLL